MTPPNPFEKALAEIDQIGSLETARMTLRWALEKLRAYEQQAASADVRARELLAKDLSLAAEENARLQAHVTRLEQRLALFAREGLDPAKLVRLETDLERRAEDLRRRQEQALEDLRRERDLAQGEAERTREQAKREARAETAAAREELATRFVDLNERMVSLRTRERALEERAQRLAEEEARRRKEADALMEERASAIEEKARRLMTATLGGAKSDWDAERRLLLDQLADLRARAREALPEHAAALRRADELAAENQDLKQAAAVVGELRRRLEDEIAGLREQVRSESIARDAAGRAAEDLRLRAEALERALSDERRRAEEAREESRRERSATLAREQALKGVEEVLNARLRDAEKAMVASYDSWREREDERRRAGNRWLRDVEARRRRDEEEHGRLEELRTALSEAIARYRAMAAPRRTSETQEGGS